MGARLNVTDKQLADLASDLDDMQEHLKKKIEQLNTIVDRIETGWRSSAARAYKELQTGINEDAKTIRKNLILIEEAVRMSRGGFNAQELETMESFQRSSSTFTDSDSAQQLTQYCIDKNSQEIEKWLSGPPSADDPRKTFTSATPDGEPSGRAAFKTEYKTEGMQTSTHEVYNVATRLKYDPNLNPPFVVETSMPSPNEN